MQDWKTQHQSCTDRFRIRQSCSKLALFFIWSRPTHVLTGCAEYLVESNVIESVRVIGPTLESGAFVCSDVIEVGVFCCVTMTSFICLLRSHCLWPYARLYVAAAAVDAGRQCIRAVSVLFEPTITKLPVFGFKSGYFGSKFWLWEPPSVDSGSCIVSQSRFLV